MAINFQELRDKMSPERRAKNKAETQELMRQIDEQKAKDEKQAQENQ